MTSAADIPTRAVIDGRSRLLLGRRDPQDARLRDRAMSAELQGIPVRAIEPSAVAFAAAAQVRLPELQSVVDVLAALGAGGSPEWEEPVIPAVLLRDCVAGRWLRLPGADRRPAEMP